MTLLRLSIGKFAQRSSQTAATVAGRAVVTVQQQHHRSLATAMAVGKKSEVTAVEIPDYLLCAPATDITTLDNGMRVASETIAASETATVGVWIDAGSRYETESNNGAAHFLEHMAFKGTGKRTQKQLEVEIENMGGHLNAYTSREQTVYFAKVFKTDVEKAMEILSDILLHSKLDPAAIEREKDVILREMMEVNKKQEELVLDHLHATAYQGCGLGRTILGSQDNIANMKQSDLKSYINTHYTAPRMVVAGAGAVDHQQLCGLASKYFGNLPTGGGSGGSAVDVAMEPALFTGSDYRVKFNTDDTAHIALAFETAPWTSEYAFPLMIMQTMLGSYDRAQGIGRNYASRLCQEVAEEELAHSVHTFNTSYKDTGLFGVYMSCQDIKADDLMWHVMNNLVRLVHSPSEEEVERAKFNLKSTMLASLDGHWNIAEDIGRQILTYGRRMTPAEIFTRINAVSVADVRATAAKFINDQDHALAAVGGIHGVPDYNWIRSHSYWLR